MEGEDKEFVTILIPTAPTPLSGFVIMVPKEDTIDLGISIEEALRFIISAGVVGAAAGAVGSAAERLGS